MDIIFVHTNFEIKWPHPLYFTVFGPIKHGKEQWILYKFVNYYVKIERA